MPDNILSERLVDIDVDEGLADADTADAELQGNSHYLQSRCAGVAADVSREAAGVRAVAAASLRLVPGDGAVGAVQYQRYPSLRPQCVEGVQEPLVHILYGAGRSAALKFSRGEVFCRYHIDVCWSVKKGQRASSRGPLPCAALLLPAVDIGRRRLGGVPIFRLRVFARMSVKIVDLDGGVAVGELDAQALTYGLTGLN